MTRRFLLALMIASCSAAALAQGQPRPAAPTNSPMQFESVQEGTEEACGPACRRWISATGTIVETTPQDFAVFVKDRDLRDVFVVLNSTGGSVAKGLALGREFRRLGLNTAVGITLKPDSKISSRATCNSMCVFLLLAGVKRHVPENARILVHQIWPASNRADATATTYSAETMVVTQRILGEIAQYVVDMGAGIELFRIATHVPPWENLRPLSREELNRLHVHTGEDTGLPFVDPGSAAAMSPGSERAATPPALGWTFAPEQQSLLRRHPLTTDGQPIGSFEIAFRCGDAPDSYRVDYAEKRAASAGSDIRLDAVGITIERERAILKVESSQATSSGGELLSTARGHVSGKFMNSLGATGNAQLIVATATTSQMRTVIRVGRNGLAENLAKLTAQCPH
jgi:hypothetical protein